MKHALPACFLLSILAGCQTPRLSSVQTFCDPPAGWLDLEGRAPSLEARDCHLEVGRDVALVDPTVFAADLDAGVHVAFAGGKTQGFAGIFLQDSGLADRSFYAVAVRPSGEWRAFRSSSPLDPVGGKGWVSAVDGSPAGYLRLGISVRGDDVRLLIDGRPMGAYKLEPAADSGKGGGRALVLGILSRGVSTRWKNWAAGASDREGAFDPDSEAYWGAPADASALLGGAAAEAKAFSSRPGRMAVFPVVASLEQALEILRAGGDPAALSAAEGEAARLLEAMRPKAAKVNADGFLIAAFAGLNKSAVAAIGSELASRYAEDARKAEAAGQPARALCLWVAADSSGGDPAAKGRIAELGKRLPPLRLDLVFEGDPPDPIFDPVVEGGRVVGAIYGNLPREEGGELRIELRTLRSSHDAETADRTRRVVLYERGGKKLSELVAERTKLEVALPEQLAEAQARANILRLGVRGGGRSLAGEVRPVTLGGKQYDLLAADAKQLETGYRRLAEVGEQIAAEEKVESVRHADVPAKLQTDSIGYEFAVTVDLDSKRLVTIPKERVYRGIEQWAHPADRKLGIPASRVEAGVVAEAVDTVRAASMERFRTAISTDNILGKLDPEGQLAFSVRLARTSGTREAQAVLEWTLQEVLGIRGELRGKIARGVAGQSR